MHFNDCIARADLQFSRSKSVSMISVSNSFLIKLPAKEMKDIYGLFLLSIAKCNVQVMVVGGVVDFLWREEEKFITKLEMPHGTVQNPIDQVIKS